MFRSSWNKTSVETSHPVKVLVVGYGSVGSRHARILKELGCHVSIVSRRDIKEERCYKNLALALSNDNPDYVVIANETEEHFNAFSQLDELGFRGTVLTEKPLFHSFQKLPANKFRDAFVLYNLRFHPLIQKMKMVLQGEEIVSAHVYTGQYLPDWRPEHDYRRCYSAKKPGGGVLRDISHELDFCIWMLGPWNRVVASGGHLSSLDIQSDDVFSLLMETERCPVLSIQLNYLDRHSRREVIVNTNQHTVNIDLIQHTIQIDEETVRLPCDRDDTFRAQHQAILNGNREILCTLDEGVDLLYLIDCAEMSASQRKWISRSTIGS